MASILVINPPISFEGSLFNDPPFSNLGMYYSLGHLEGNFDVDVIDSFLSDSPIKLNYGTFNIGRSYDNLILEIHERPKLYDYVLVNLSWFKRKELKKVGFDAFRDFIRDLKDETGAHICLCDFHIGHTFFEDYDSEFYLRSVPEIDTILLGVAERRLLDFLLSGSPGSVPNMAYRDGTDIISSDPDLDYVAQLSGAAPYPSYNLIDMDKYMGFIAEAKRFNLIQEQHDGKHTLPLLLSRGCAFNCNFCGLGAGKSNWAPYPPSYVEDLLLYHKNNYGIDRFIFLDSSMNSNPSWFKRILKILKKNSLRCFIPNGLRGDLIDDEATELLKEVTDMVMVSLETSNDRIVNGFCGKSFNIQGFHSFIEKAYSIKLTVKAHYIIGFPEETIKDMNETLRHAMYLYDEYNVSPLLEIATPLPDTPFFEYCKTNGLLSVDEEEVLDNYHTAIEERSFITGPNFDADDVTTLYSMFKRYVTENRMREVIINTSFQCNDNCIHCLFKNVSTPQKNLDECRSLLDEAKANSVHVVCFEGGEPTLHPDIIRLVAYAKSLGFSDIFMESNGRMFSNREFTRKIFKAGLWPLHVALHSWRHDVHDSIVQNKGSHAQVIKGLRNIVELGYKGKVKINIPFNKSNLNDVEKTVYLCKSLGFREVFLQYLTHKRGLKDPDELPAYGESSKVMKRVIDRFGDDMLILTQNMPVCKMKGYEDNVLPDMGNTGYFDELGERKAIALELAYGKIKDKSCDDCLYSFLCTGYIPEKD
ncbi:MAG: radical SAM protein [Candidatus Woesearchaeota archaeon]